MRPSDIFSFFAFIILFTCFSSTGSLFAQGRTEKILFNGKIFTASPNSTVAEAVSISGDKIVAVGSFASVRGSVSDGAELIDLKGKCLLPGLIDSHIHAIGGGESLMIATLNDVLLSKEELGKFAKEAIESKKGLRGDVLYIGGVHSSTWASVGDLIDLFNKAPFNSQAVVLRGSDKHTSWANNVVLKRAGINAQFIHGLSAAEKKYFGFNQADEPNGLISEKGYQKIDEVLPASPIRPLDAAENGGKYLNSLGITAWLDPSAGNIEDGESNSHLEVYSTLLGQKKLNAHVTAVVVANASEDPAPQVAIIKKLQQRYKNVEGMRVLGFKIFADGVLEYPTQTAAVSIPYLNSGQNGSLMFEPSKFKAFAAFADKEGLLVHVHAIGDRAVTETLNGFAHMRQSNGNADIAHSITHLQIVVPADFKRFSHLKIIPSMQLLWANADNYVVDLVKPYIDPSLYRRQYPAMSLLRAGAKIAGASDWPVSSANPFEAIHMGETRVGKKGVLEATEVMTRVEMLKAYTINAAKVLMMEKTIGSIEPGKQADFVLVDRDVLSVSSDDVNKTSVIWTMFAGKIVYSK
ncbi:MAG TPA: amidohydrolase [Chryseolinea sp.]|nr:amidohydrolase [Chryseolinea sp.]